MVAPAQFCDHCGFANRSQGKFCANCGSLLQTISYSNQRTSNEKTASTSPLAPGSLLQQRYRIAEQIGQGGFASVYKVADTRFRNTYRAIKEMSQSGLAAQDLQEAVQAFEHEAMLLSELMHPNLPRIYDHFSENGLWYLVMDFIEGDTLEDRLKIAPDHKLSFEEIAQIGLQLCTVLDYLHTHKPPIIFRDLKPANIMLTKRGHVFLIDFGIARLFKLGKTKDTVALGSPGYAAPEQYGKAQTTSAADIYSLGATLHHMLSGIDPSFNPFKFAPLHLASAYQDLERLVLEMVSTDVARRPDITEVRQVLQQMTIQPQAGYTPGNTTHPSSSNQYSSASRSRSTVNPGNRGALISTYYNHDARVQALAWSPDGKYIASGSADNTVHVWEAVSGHEVLIYDKHKDEVNAVAWSPDGKYIASGSDDKTMRIWDARSGSKLYKYEEHTDYVRAVAWSPDSTCVASASDDGTVQVFNIDEEETSITYGEHDVSSNYTDSVLAVAWSPDGEYIVSGDDNNTVRVWEADTGDTLFFYEKHDNDINAVAWSPDGLYIASASDDKTVRVRNAKTGKKIHTYRYKHTGFVRSIAWSPDSAYIASAGDDGTVRLWSATTGLDIFIYAAHGDEKVLAVAWSPDGKLIVSGTESGTVHVWQAI